MIHASWNSRRRNRAEYGAETVNSIRLKIKRRETYTVVKSMRDHFLLGHPH